MKVDEILKKKARKAITVSPDAPIAEVAKRMRDERVGCVVASADGKRIDGILAARDVVYALADREARVRERSGSEILDTKVSELMGTQVKTCVPSDSLPRVIKEMIDFHIFHVPVLDGGKLCGVISIDDVLKYRIEEVELESRVLRDHLTVRDAGRK